MPIWNKVNSRSRRGPKNELLKIKKQEISGEHDARPKRHIARLPAAREKAARSVISVKTIGKISYRTEDLIGKSLPSALGCFASADNKGQAQSAEDPIEVEIYRT